MTTALASLIDQARTELGSTACQAGNHYWVSEGGRSCPFEFTDTCSQTVYRCSVCGDYDYGDRGGPGWNDCERHCPHKFARQVLLTKLVGDPLSHWWPGIDRSIVDEIVFHIKRLRALRRQRKPRLP